MTQLLPQKDYGYSIEKCTSAIAACKALTVTDDQRQHWESVLAWWESQLKFAENRVS